MENKKIDRKVILEKGNGTLREFKEFISKGNVIDLAVGVIVGNAFSKIVTSLVNNLLTPLIGVVLGGLDFSNLSFTIGDSVVSYGAFIQSVIDFLIIAICVFVMIKILGMFNKKEKAEEKEEPKEIKKDDQILLLEEIRDLLKEKES